MPEQSIISVISLSSSPLIQRTCVSLNLCLIGGRGGCQSRPFHAFISMEGVASMKQHQNMFFHALLETASSTLRLPVGCGQTQEADFGGTRVSHSQKVLSIQHTLHSQQSFIICLNVKLTLSSKPFPN
ncbi:hypothetical protein AMTRI_Chr10g1800 [Amborella trichopoda]